MKTNIKGLILTIILLIGLLNIKYPYAQSNTNQIHSINEERQSKSVVQAVKPKNESTTQEKTTNNNNNNNNNNNTNNTTTTNTTTNTETNKEQVVIHKEPIEKQPSRGGNINIPIDITLTFYSSLAVENGGFTGINCSGKKLTPGTVANNVLPLGTKIHTEEFGTLTVEDRGGNNFDTIHRLDVYVPREEGENDTDYLKRVNNMGRVKIKGYIVQ